MNTFPKRLRDWAGTAASILAGNALLAFLVEAFVVPHGLIMAGTTGIGIAITRLIPVDVSLVVLVLNVILLLLGLTLLGWNFFVTTVASSLLYPMFLAIFERVPGIGSLTDDPLLATLLGGVLMGISLGLVMRVGSSTGGTDVVSLIMSKYLHWQLSVCVWIVDITTLAMQLGTASSSQMLYGVVIIVLETIALNRVMIMGRGQVQLLAVSPRYEDIREACLNELGAGVTMLCTETGLTGQEQKSVVCVIPPRKIFRAKELIHDIDPDAFLTITEVQEVQGGRVFTEEWTRGPAGTKASGKGAEK